VKLLYYI